MFYFVRWEGTGVNEIGKDKDTGEVHVKINPKFYRPTEVVSSMQNLYFSSTIIRIIISIVNLHHLARID